jgi:hypothetical protein
MNVMLQNATLPSKLIFTRSQQNKDDICANFRGRTLISAN